MWRLLSCVALALFAVSFHTTGVSAAYDGLKLDGIFDDFEAKLNLEDLNIAERYQITGFGDLARLSPLSQELLSKAQRTLIIRKKPEVEYEGAESLEGESTAEDEGFVSAAVHPKNSTDEEVVAMQADEPAKQAATEKRGHGARRRRGKCTDIIDPNENPLLKPFADAIGEVKKFLLLDTYVVECVSQEAAIAMALKLQKVDEVEDVSFDDLVMSQQQTWSNDPYLSNAGQYNVLNTDSRYDIGVGRAVGVARDRVSKTSNLDSLRDEPVLVSVPDSGIDLFHPDLKNMIWSNSGEIPNNGKDDDENG
uniref:subtilisin n=1 Tax=Chromera velia CCMP2878 TaxID=1169474 RepID=A0A0G4HQB5_9ALVE|eukprot:Cvel_30144.t1-p1 / transcript=Cvel_30144.t1 / gene=Cvel_30144 / organism=Chromera_velia_CCMP2878 / gene_product=hypothetical protein / transcript_product=hypothetical protein / location=Cvel_scaffold4255:323-1961(-) / protein_length=307 / sequence_SO=supercontig / SO=protein_coding / is_pseudo=false